MSTSQPIQAPPPPTDARAHALAGALPALQRLRGATLVIKYGGSVLEDETLAAAWARDLATLVRLDVRPVVVHGGGPELTRLMQRLGLEARFVDGHRVTCAETAALAEMVFSGRLNKQIVALLGRSGVRAVGLSGSDGGCLQVRTHRPDGRDIGFVGAVESVDASLLTHLLDGGFVPVVSPTAADASGQTHNINADVVAAAVAGALHAAELVFLSDVPGYMEDGRCVARMDTTRLRTVLAQATVNGGMRPKLVAAHEALDSGVGQVRLLDGRAPHILLAALCFAAEAGTRIVPAPGTGAQDPTEARHRTDARHHESQCDSHVQVRHAATPPHHAEAVSRPAWAGTLGARGAKALMDTYTREPLELAGGRGCHAMDSFGREYLDFGAGIAVNALGHAHPAIVATLHARADSLVHTSNLYWTEPMVRLAERLVEATGMERVFFCNSGAEAVEAALKLARRARPGRPGCVVFEGSFHGRTLGALSATMQEAYQAPFRPLLADFTAVPYGDLGAAREAITATTALVLVEPIQGEGGVRPAPDGFLAALRQLCAASGALLVFDEVQTGVGRTGMFLAAQNEGVVPDAVALAKGLAGGLPMGALLARGTAATALGRGEHGSTFGGGALVASVAHAVLDVVLAPGFLDGVRARGARLGDGLARLAAAHPETVLAVRGRGLMWGLVLREPRAPDLVTSLREQGLLALQAGKNVLRLLPPLVVGDDDIDVALGLLARGLAQLALPAPTATVP